MFNMDVVITGIKTTKKHLTSKLSFSFCWFCVCVCISLRTSRAVIDMAMILFVGVIFLLTPTVMTADKQQRMYLTTVCLI